MEKRHVWDRIARGYAEKRGFGKGLMRGEKYFLSSHFAKFCKGNVLDVGCGTGRHLRSLKSIGLRVVGVDFSRKMLNEARKLGNEPYVLADAGTLPFEDKAFDCSVCLGNTIGSAENPEKIVEEMIRVSKKHVIIDFRHEKGKKGVQKRRFDSGYYDTRVWSAEEARKFLSPKIGKSRMRFVKGQKVERGYFFYAVISK